MTDDHMVTPCHSFYGRQVIEITDDHPVIARVLRLAILSYGQRAQLSMKFNTVEVPSSCDSQQSSSMEIQWSRTDPTQYRWDQIIQLENVCLHQISKIVNKFLEYDSLLFIREHFHKEPKIYIFSG